MKFNNSFFFNSNFLNLKKNTIYLQSLKKCQKSASLLANEFRNKSNEILNTFSSKYQRETKHFKKKIFYPNKKTVIIGMGGSSAGTKAISSFLKKDIFFFDNLDFNNFYNFINTKNILNYNYFVISKSGETHETLAILNLLIKNILKKKYPINKIIYIISDNKKNLLGDFALKQNLTFIESNKNLVGRYSVFSKSNLFPLNNIIKKIYKSTDFFIKILESKNHNLSPVINASLIYYFWKKRKTTSYVNLIYNYNLKHFSYWLHQLHAESLGKNLDGLLPYTSICPKDHHSMMQLFLDGPRDKIFNVFAPEKKKIESFSNLGFGNIENEKPNKLIYNQFKSIVELFKEKKIPHRIIEFEDDNDPRNIFDLLAYFILETIILGYASGIDPYDQPAVQKIKEKLLNIKFQKKNFR